MISFFKPDKNCQARLNQDHDPNQSFGLPNQVKEKNPQPKSRSKPKHSFGLKHQTIVKENIETEVERSNPKPSLVKPKPKFGNKSNQVQDQIINQVYDQNPKLMFRFQPKQVRTNINKPSS